MVAENKNGGVKLEHAAIWTTQLEALRQFYETYFQARAGEKYSNPRKGFESYFLTFEEGARLEIMTMASIESRPVLPPAQAIGYAHLAFAVGSKESVDALTGRLHADGFRILDGPRRTGDGYYESVILDPDGNRVEITD